LETRETPGHLVRPVRDFLDRRFDPLSKIVDHSSGESLVFKTSLSVFRRVDESREDVSDIVQPTVVGLT